MLGPNGLNPLSTDPLATSAFDLPDRLAGQGAIRR